MGHLRVKAMVTKLYYCDQGVYAGQFRYAVSGYATEEEYRQIEEFFENLQKGHDEQG